KGHDPPTRRRAEIARGALPPPLDPRPSLRPVLGSRTLLTEGCPGPPRLPRRLRRPRHGLRTIHRRHTLASLPTRDKVSGRLVHADDRDAQSARRPTHVEAHLHALAQAADARDGAQDLNEGELEVVLAS